MRFVTFDEAAALVRGKRVAIVGGGPSAMDNRPGFVDDHDVVVRVNNYRLGNEQGRRTDIFYSFFGSSIRKTAEELQRDGVRLCWCKCPNSKPISCDWHEQRGKTTGVDFRYIYANRAAWWPCDTFIPDDARFLRSFNLLGRHVPTTGFAAILDVLEARPASLYVTGFDFFRSGQHNLDERWRPGDPADPIGHRPEMERAWLHINAPNYPITFDRILKELIA